MRKKRASVAKLASLIAMEACRMAQSGELQALEPEPPPQEDQPFDMAGFAAEIAERLGSLTPLTPEETRARDFSLSISPRLELAGFPARYRVDGRFNGADERCAKQKAVLQKLRDRCRNVGAIIVLVGPRGTGKTSITAEFAAERLWAFWEIAQESRRPITCPEIFYAKTTDIVGKLKPLYANFGTIDSQALEGFRRFLVSCDLLIIDELQEATEDGRFKDPILADIADKRYSNGKDLLLITNQTAQNFIDTINPSIASRLREHGGIIPCEWESFRDKPPCH